jgi:single-strand DNA-binding protein
MADLNMVALTGRLTRDAELKYTQSGMAILEFAVACNQKKKQGDQWVDDPHFFDVTVFGRQGEAIQRYAVKGKRVAIDGRLKQDRWQNKEGQNRSKVGIVADNVVLLSGGEERQESAPRKPAERPVLKPESDDFGDDDVWFDDKVPF